MMVRDRRRQFAIPVFEKEYMILEVIDSIGACTTVQVQEKLGNAPDLLTVMRSMHALVDRGLLERVTVNNQKLYQVKSNYRISVRTYLKVTDRKNDAVFS